MRSNRNEERSIREVVSVSRTTKTSGGAMRPRVRAYHVCTLTCGHIVEKIKSKTTGWKPPVRMACPECRAAKELDAQG